MAGNVRICVCWLHHSNDRHFRLSPTCRECQPDTLATFCYVSHFFGCQCCVGEAYPQHAFLHVGRKWCYTFLGTYNVYYACRNQIFLLQRTFMRSTQHKEMLSCLRAFHAFARSTQHRKLLSRFGAFHALVVYHSKGGGQLGSSSRGLSLKGQFSPLLNQ